MRVLLSGSSGFLAQHFIPKFQKEGHFVIGVDKRPERHKSDYFIQDDVRNLGYRDLMGVDYVVSNAWRTNIPDCSRHPEDSTEDNIDMTIHLLELCKEAKIKRVFFPSTASLYGNNPTPWTENMPAEPIEHYSWQKLACEEACKMYSRSLGLDTVIARFFQVFGEFQRDDTALSHFIKAKKDGKQIALTETTAQSSFKSGQRDFIYAGDVADAVYLLTTNPKMGGGEIYNVCSGQFHTMEDIAKVLDAEVYWIERRPWEVERHLGDVSKLSALGWVPKTEVLSWLRKQT